MTLRMAETFQWLRDNGFMKGKAMRVFTDDEKMEMSRAFDAGNYANAYETTDLLACEEIEDMSEHERVAFVLGFFGSYTLDEIGSDRELFDECYFSDAGRYVVNVAKYTDDRAEEYADEETERAS